MRIHRLFAVLLLGSSSLAAAQPAYSPAGSYGPIVRDHRGANLQHFRIADYGRGWYGYSSPSRDEDCYAGDMDEDDCPRVPPPDGDAMEGYGPQGPVVLAQSRLSDDREHRAFVNIGAQRGRFRTLQIDASAGMYVNEIGVEFANGRRQLVVWPRTFLGGRQQSLTIDLGTPSPVNRVLVYGRNASWQSSFTVSGM